jgi:O-antigen ligase
MDRSFRPYMLAGIALGLGAGAVAAHAPRQGIAVAAALVLAASAYFGFRATFALWIPAFFVPFLSPGNAALKAGAVLAVVAFAVTLTRESESLRRNVVASSSIMGILALLVAWLALSSLWAQEPGVAVAQLRWYGLSAFVFVGAIAAIRTEQHLRVVITAFVAGALLTTVAALVGVNDRSGDLLQHAGTTVSASAGRLEGGTGDPNVFAAALLAAIALAGGLALSSRSPRVRVVMVACVALFGVGAVESQSRGGMIAAGLALATAFAVLKGNRGRIALLLVAAAAGLILWLIALGGSLSRFTNFGDKGDGRDELWRIAWQMTRDHPIWGVGLQNFRPRVPEYVLAPGSLQFIHLLIERPVVVHNTYLQFLAETGIIGLALFSALVLVCLRSMLLAGRVFERCGEVELSTLCRCVFVAAIALLAAGFFFSEGVDYKLWVVLALGPASLRIAQRRTAFAPTTLQVQRLEAVDPAKLSAPIPNEAFFEHHDVPTVEIPRVAVIIVSRHNRTMILEAIASCRSQERCEVVIVQAGVSDTVQELHLESARRSGIRVLYHETSRSSDIRMRGLAETSAPYVYVLDSDSAIGSRALRELADELDRSPRTGVVWGDVGNLGSGSAIERTPDRLDPWAITVVNQIPRGALIRREALLELGGWWSSDGYEDWDTWMGMAQTGWKGSRVSVVAHLTRPGSTLRAEELATMQTGPSPAARSRYPRLFAERNRNWWRSSAPLSIRVLAPVTDILPMSEVRRQRMLKVLLRHASRRQAGA